MNERTNGSKSLQYALFFLLFISFTERSCVLYATVSWIVTAHAIHRPSKDAQDFLCSHITNGDRSTLNNVSVNRGTCLSLRAKLFLIDAIGIDGLDLFFLFQSAYVAALDYDHAHHFFFGRPI